MKTTRLLAFVAALAGSALIGTAGPTSQLFRPGDKPVRTAKPTAPATPACSACKDESVRATRFVGPTNRQHVQGVELARQHSCTACGPAVAATPHDCPNVKTPGAPCCARRS